MGLKLEKNGRRAQGNTMSLELKQIVVAWPKVARLEPIVVGRARCQAGHKESGMYSEVDRKTA